MKILFLSKCDLTKGNDTGGLNASHRNFDLLLSIYGKENIFSCIITNDRKISSIHEMFFQSSDKLISRYMHYFLLREPICKSVERKIINYVNENQFTHVFFDGSLLGDIARKLDKQIKKITFFHNVEQQLFQEFYKKHSKLLYIRYLEAMRCEKIMVNQSNKLICLNDRDNKLIFKYYKRHADLILPITFYDQYENHLVKEQQCSEFLLFVGSYFTPNINGLKWYAQYVAPYLPYKTIVVGKNMEKVKNNILSNNIEIIGGVDSLSEYYINASAVIIPIFMGGGMKVKTAEALMYGKAIFATHEALEGYSVEGEPLIKECNTSQEFIHNITDYMKLENKEKTNHSIRNLFKEKYVTDAYREKLQQVIEGM